MAGKKPGPRKSKPRAAEKRATSPEYTSVSVITRPRARTVGFHIRLRECLAEYERRTGRALSYRELAARADMSYDAVKAIATRPRYNASIKTVATLCSVLGVSLADMVVLD